MNKIQEEISNNLYAFYDQISLVSNIPSDKQDHWSMIQNTPGTWPRIIYRLSPDMIEPGSSSLFSEKVNPIAIGSGSYPEVLIAGEENIGQIDPFLRSRGFYPFAGWKGMAVNKELWESFINFKKTFPKLPDNIEILKIESSPDLEQWIKVVTSQLVAPARLEKSLLESLIAQPNFEAYLLKHDGVGVSTILVFTSEHSTGLYLIATEQSSQRKGFAQLLVQQVMYRIAQRSIHPVVLHATPKGEALYARLGFKPYNQFFLYRSVI